jgi:hypothetical protein
MLLKDSLHALFFAAQSELDAPTRIKLADGLQVEVTFQSNDWTLFIVSRVGGYPTEEEYAKVIASLPITPPMMITPVAEEGSDKGYIATMFPTVLIERMNDKR